jgi:hypothetical protein
VLGRAGRGTDRMRHRLIISTPHRTAVVVAAALSLTACGASGGGAAGGTTTSGGDTKLIAMSHCMRAHGVPNFPDPSSSAGGGVGMSVTMTPESSAVTVAGVIFSGPAFTTAEKACHFGEYGSKPKLTEAQKQGMLKSAECMRTHRVPNFPDPTFGANGGVKIDSSQINPNSPAFQAAAKACRGAGMGIPGGG